MSNNDIRNITELSDVAKLFYGDDFPCTELYVLGDGEFEVKTQSQTFSFKYDDPVYSVIPPEHRSGRLSKIAVYDALTLLTGKTMPWGALTGVRPTKLFYECMRRGNTENQTEKIMRDLYRISDKRADILGKIVRAQRGKYEFPSQYVNLYVHIPYCTSRCTYCSFVSSPIRKNEEQAKIYVDLLCDEIKKSLEYLHNTNKKILSIYIGGGTPTALDAPLLDKLLDAIGDGKCEYTCEAGRPDTIDENKIEIMKAHGVTRVCVNPQTLNDETLVKIGRSHTAARFYEVYELVKNSGFDINCDLIAGLADETPSDFEKSYNGIVKLAPQNITVHSLAKKNGSAIRYDSGENAAAASMLDHVLDDLGEYSPYYLYRQKRQSCNLENVGLSLPGKECINNITTMEETASVMACGAGAISKIIKNGNITRFANMRDVPLYISRYDEKLRAKLECFDA